MKIQPLSIACRFVTMWTLLLLQGGRSFTIRRSPQIGKDLVVSNGWRLSTGRTHPHTSRRLHKVRASAVTIPSSDEGTKKETRNRPSPSRKESIFPSIILKRNRQSRMFWEGSQLVFPGSIQRMIDRPDSKLELASFVQVEVPLSTDVSNKQTQVVGWGVYNPNSIYGVRILCHARPKTSLSAQLLQLSSSSSTLEGSNQQEMSALSLILVTKLDRAFQLRRVMGFGAGRSSASQDISGATDTFRLVNGEGDGLSGLAVDIIGDEVAVVMSSAAWCQVYQSEIVSALEHVLPDHFEIIWKTTPSRLKQDGYIDQTDHTEDDGSHQEENDTMIVATENGVKYQTFPYRKHGQKTSFYCDQRENREYLAQFCQDKHVLDLCCYHGGFSLNALLNGAASVIGVDSSQDAVDTCNANLQLNGLFGKTDEDPPVAFTRADISDYMQDAAAKNDKYKQDGEEQKFFDVIILDPPKLAPSVSGLTKATRKYHSLNRDALKLINEIEGGLFLTCSCSAAMTQKEGGMYFLQTVQQAGLAAGRELTLLRVSGAASCHTQSPASSPAGHYLTAALFRVHPKG